MSEENWEEDEMGVVVPASEEAWDEIVEELGSIEEEQEDSSEDIPEFKTVSPGNLDIEFKPYYAIQKPKTVALLKVDMNQEWGVREYKPGSDYPYHFLFEVEHEIFIDLNGKNHTDEDTNIVWQLPKKMTKKMDKILLQRKGEGWRYVLSYRETQRRSHIKVISDEEAERCKEMETQKEILQHFFIE